MIADAMKGRILCDTYLSAKELLRETTYSLTNLASTQLKTQRVEIEPVDIPQWFDSSEDIVKLAMYTPHDHSWYSVSCLNFRSYHCQNN